MADEKHLQGVAYYRVSTMRQGQSGLGLEAQRQAVLSFVASQQGKLELRAEFTEMQSGKRNDRRVLTEALEYCKKHRATLILAKLDRLSRKVSFVANLLDAGVDFVCVEYPTRDKFWIHLQSAFAEEEGRRISQRTKLALKAARERGTIIGATGKLLAERHKAGAMVVAKTHLKTVLELRRSGVTTVKATMEALNGMGVPSPGGARWHHRSTWKLLVRLGFSGTRTDC